MNDKLSCPVGGGYINENKVRLVAGQVLLATVLYLLTNGRWIGAPALLLLLGVDFGLRSGAWGRYSPFGFVADQLVRGLRLPDKRTAGAPKQFAARIGLLVSLLLLFLQAAGAPTVILAAALLLFAALESLAGLCVGCYLYTFYLRLLARAA